MQKNLNAISQAIQRDSATSTKEISKIIRARLKVPEYLSFEADEIVQGMVHKYEYEKEGAKKVDWKLMIDDLTEFDFEQDKEH